MSQMAMKACQLKLTKMVLTLQCTIYSRACVNSLSREIIMIIDKVLSLKTDAGLLKAIELAANRKLSANEIQEQRVSYVYGSMGNHNSVTREQVRRVIRAQEGKTQAFAA